MSNRLGFVGLGSMGLAMAINLHTYLQSNGLPPLTVYNRTFIKTQPLVEQGAFAAESLREVVENSDIIFTSMSNDAAVEQLYENLFALTASGGRNGRDVVFVETSTVYPTTTKAIADKAATVNGRYLIACPVFGAPQAAKAAQLVIVTAGHEWAVELVKPYLVPAIGKQIINMGTEVEKALELKLNGNMFIVGILEILAEGMTLAEKTGVGRAKFMELIGAMFPLPSTLTYGTRMQKDLYATDVGFPVTLGMKDVRHMRRLADEADASIPVTDIAFQHLKAVKANGGGDYDWSALVGALRLSAGLPLGPTENTQK